MIHLDVWGPYKHYTHDGYTYFITIVDDFIRYTLVQLLKNKNDAFTTIMEFIHLIHNQFGIMVKAIRSDNAYELGSSNEGIQFYASRGIIHQKSMPHTPQQNGLLERKHRHILETARSFYFQSRIGIAFGENVLELLFI